MKSKTRKQTDRNYHLRRVQSGVVPVRKHLMHYWGVRAKPMAHPNRAAIVSQPFKSKDRALKFLKALEAENKLSKIGVVWGEPKVVKLDGRDSDRDGVPDVVDCAPKDPTKQDIKTHTHTHYTSTDKDKEGFTFTFKPVEDSVKITPTADGFEARYVTQDQDPTSPAEDQDDDAFLVHYHRDFEVERDSVLRKDDLQDLYLGEKTEKTAELKKKYWIFPVDAYIHGGVALSLAGGFAGRLPQGHERFDVSSVGAVFLAKSEWKSEKKAEAYARGHVETWNQYLSGDVYTIVKETYNKAKEKIDHDNVCGYYGYKDAVAALQHDI